MKDIFVFDGDKCISNTLDILLEFKAEERKAKIIYDYNSQFHAPYGSGFDTSIILDNVPFDIHIDDFI